MYVPILSEGKFHFYLVDEIDEATYQALVAFLSVVEAHQIPPYVICIFTCNSTKKLPPRFVSRCQVLEFSSFGLRDDIASLLSRIWGIEAPPGVHLPNFFQIAKDSRNNVRDALNKLQTELLIAQSEPLAAVLDQPQNDCQVVKT